MDRTTARLSSWALLVGSVVATVGYLLAFLANGNGAERFTGSSWTTLYTIALFGDVLIVLGLPTLVRLHGDHPRKLTIVGYVGVLVPIVVLNIGEGCLEAFAKPYLADHGGIPDNLAGLTAFEAPALLIMLIGLICLGVAVFRARVLPRWVGAFFVVSPLPAMFGLSGGAALISDYLAFAGLFLVAVYALRRTPAVTPAQPSSQSASRGIAQLPTRSSQTPTPS
jgi:hypothetical protein